jgi:hypothetical protein
MIDALLKGKLSRNQENMEDILTSNVFGTFKYNPDHRPLLTFLSKARSATGEPAFNVLPDNAGIDFAFWPWLDDAAGGCEPDVLLRINYDGTEKYLILIEAKLWSGKSLARKLATNLDTEPSQLAQDQLAREWLCLKSLAQSENAHPKLIYLTSDTICPANDIIESQNALVLNSGEKGSIFWLSWRCLPSILDQFTESEMFHDLAKSLRYLDLIFFEGFSSFKAHSFTWTYQTGEGL